MKGKIFFIVGVQRSGTTLLQKVLSKHPEVLMQQRSIAFRIITCFRNMYDLLPFNVQHDKKEFLQWLIENDEKGRLAELIDYQNLEEYDNVRDLIKQSIYKKIDASGKKIWVDKSPNLQHYMNDLMLLIPEAKILHIVRDGRANAYSTSNRSYRDIELSAQEWVDGNIFGLVNQEMLGKENYKMLKYENLLTAPETEIKSVCDFLKIPFSKSMLDLSDDDLKEDKKYVKSFFDTSKINNWKEKFSQKEIKKVEKIQARLLAKLGYELENKDTGFKNLSVGRRIFLKQKDNVKLLFKKKRMGMKEQEMVELNLSFKHRLYTFLMVLIRDIMSRSIFKSLFSRYFFSEKYFKKDKK